MALTRCHDSCRAHSTTFREYQRKQVQPLRKVRRLSAQRGAARHGAHASHNAERVPAPQSVERILVSLKRRGGPSAASRGQEAQLEALERRHLEHRGGGSDGDGMVTDSDEEGSDDEEEESSGPEEDRRAKHHPSVCVVKRLR